RFRRAEEAVAPIPTLRRRCAPADLRGGSAMQAIDAGRPWGAWMLRRRGAVALQKGRQLDLQWVLNFGRLRENPQQRGSGGDCDGESLADEIRAALPLALDSIERCCDDGAISLQMVFANTMAESVERWKNPEQRPQPAVGPAAHGRRQHAQ